MLRGTFNQMHKCHFWCSQISDSMAIVVLTIESAHGHPVYFYFPFLCHVYPPSFEAQVFLLHPLMLKLPLQVIYNNAEGV